MEQLIAVMVLLSLIINMIGIGVVAKNQGFILDKIEQLRKELWERTK
jgi:hypothetical protein